LLSVLIPAYNQPAGVERILDRLAGLGKSGEVEVRVSDDSTDDAAATRIAAAVQTWSSGPLAACPAWQYQRNQPPLGAVRNWNALLAQATGRYVWLLHHDEEPDAAVALKPLLAQLQEDTADVWILRCHVQRQPGGPRRLHFPPRRAAALLRRWPGYLLRRNLIGPPSALIVRDHAVAKYDETLAWLVDVEFYMRVLASGVQLGAWPHAGVLSHVDGVNSITAALQPELAATARRELDLIAGGVLNAQAKLWAGRTLRSSLLRATETLLWAGWRAGQRLFARADPP